MRQPGLPFPPIPGSAFATIFDDALHVWPSRFGWKVTGKHGDYGICPSQTKALSLARDVCATSGIQPIHVYTATGALDFTLHGATGSPSPQFFQDDVP